LIEPMAQVAWSDRWGQDPPDEDSRLVEFDEGNLLSIDRFPGSDRRETGLRAVVGLNWAHLGTGWSAGAAVGRVFRGEGDADFTQASGLAGARSDWLVAGQLVWDARLYLTGRALIGDDLSVAKAEAVLNYRQDGLR